MSDAQPNKIMVEAETILEQLREFHVQRGVIPPTTEKPSEPSKFFAMEGKYLIAQGTATEALMNDSSNLMACAIGILDDGYESLSQTQYAALYLMQQAKALHDEAISNMIKEAAEETTHA